MERGSAGPCCFEKKLTVTGRMVGPISTSPLRLRLVPVYSRTGKTDEMRLTVRGLRPTKFTVEHKPEKFQVAVLPSDPSPVLDKIGVPNTPGFRVGVGPQTTDEDVTAFLDVLPDLVVDLEQVEVVSTEALARFRPPVD